MKSWRTLSGILLFLALASAISLAQYTRTDLVTNQESLAANTDAHLANAWGLVALPHSPFWVSDNDTGFSTLYNGAGQQVPLFVSIPAAQAGAQGTPTGVVGNISTNADDFSVTENGVSGRSIFIFDTLDGTISGWSPAVAGISPTGVSHATIAPGHSSDGAVYTGLAIAENAGQFLIYAADDGPNRRVDVFQADFTPAHLGATAFEDPGIPSNFAPYGIQNIGGDIWVTYTALNKAQGGFVDHFGPDGVLKKHFAALGPLHSPWGLALAPNNFGPLSNALLVSNNTSRGRINAFNPANGQFLGPLRDASGNAIEIDNVWAIQFGQDGVANGAHNQLFFTAGPNQYANGAFGVITVGP